MAIVYVPRLIESVEQAEALPEGTYAKNEATTRSGTWYAPPRVNIGRGMWSGDDLYRSAEMVGWTALVPIEAEEEWRASWPADDAHQRCRDERTARLWEQQQDAVAMHRLVTPWESV